MSQKDLAKTINESCATSFNAVTLLIAEGEKILQEYNKCVASAMTYVANEKEPKPEDIKEVLVGIQTNFIKTELMKKSVDEEVRKFQTLYTLSQLTDTPFTTGNEMLNSILTSSQALYASDGVRIVVLDEESEKLIFQDIISQAESEEGLQKTFNAVKTMTQNSQPK